MNRMVGRSTFNVDSFKCPTRLPLCCWDQCTTWKLSTDLQQDSRAVSLQSPAWVWYGFMTSFCANNLKPIHRFLWLHVSPTLENMGWPHGPSAPQMVWSERAMHNVQLVAGHGPCQTEKRCNCPLTTLLELLALENWSSADTNLPNTEIYGSLCPSQAHRPSHKPGTRQVRRSTPHHSICHVFQAFEEMLSYREPKSSSKVRTRVIDTDSV